ncbi:MAG TPA: hypothetical protein VGW74_01575, partial [Propionibacteriaceae bacterium]|nr:hypothetical protein [Propionibacteriaceae bacterium]
TELGDSRGAARILDARAMATFLDVDIRTGTELLDRAAHLFEDSGDLMRTVTPRSTRGPGLVLLNQAAAGLADARPALEIALTLGHPEGQAYALWHCAEALAVLGQAEEAVAAGNEARALATRIDHRGWTASRLAGHRSGSAGRRGPRGRTGRVPAVPSPGGPPRPLRVLGGGPDRAGPGRAGPVRRCSSPCRPSAGSRTGAGPA